MQVHIPTPTGRTIEGELTDRRSKYLVVICHGFKGSGKAAPIPSLARKLGEKGYASFTFDFPKDSATDVRKQVDDVSAIIQHFDSYKGFIMLGHSLGAISASIAAIKLPRVAGVVTINGFFGSGEPGEKYRRDYRNFRIASLFIPSYRRIWKFFKNELAPTKLTVPALVIHAETDVVVPLAHSQRHFEAITGPKEFKLLEQANHGLSRRNNVDVVVAAIDTWLKQLQATGRKPKLRLNLRTKQP